MRIKTVKCVALAIALTVPAISHADSFDTIGLLSQEQFDQLSENIAAATHYKSVAPPEPLGILGFDISVEVSSTDLDSELFDLASNGDFSTDTLLVPRLHLHKGLPFNFDIGASLTSVPDTDFQILGAEVRYAILVGTVVTPALGVRATYSAVTGVDEIESTSVGIEAAISKGFAIFTPYGGVGYIASDVTSNSPNLEDVSVEQEKVFVGVNVNLGLINFGFEGDRTGDYSTYTAKFGFRF